MDDVSVGSVGRNTYDKRYIVIIINTRLFKDGLLFCKPSLIAFASKSIQ